MFKKLKEKISDKFKTFPRSDTISFPEVQDFKYDTQKSSDVNLDLIDQTHIHYFVDDICYPYSAHFFLLKSGNILMSYHSRIRERETDLFSFLEIYSIPDLKLVQKYEFPTPDEGPVYSIANAIQLKNGNIFAIYNQFYEFKGEDIKGGPISLSEKLDSSYYPKTDQLVLS